MTTTPYIGLRPYTEDERDVFFGREREIVELLRLVEDDAVTVFYGISGVGKSSLLAAGLFPRLRERDYLPIRVRLHHYEEATPLSAQIERAVVEAARAEGIALPSPTLGESLWEFFHHSSRELWTERHRLLTPVLVLDQFEEFYSIGEETPERHARGQALLGELLDLVRNSPPASVARSRRTGRPRKGVPSAWNFDAVPLRVILTLREDFFLQLLPLVDALAEKLPSIHRQRFRLQPLARGAAGEVINGPANRGMHAPADEITVDAIVKLATGPSGVEPGTLALLLSALDEERRREGLDRFTPGLVARAGGDLFEKRIEDGLVQVPLAVQYFVEEQLVSPGGYRRAVTAHDASKALGKDAAALEQLRKDGLLQPVPGQLPRLELVHDLYCPVLVRRREARAAGAEKAALEKAENEARAAAQRAGDAERAQAEEQRLRTEAERERIDAEKARAGAGRLAAFLGVVAVAALIALGIAVFFFFDAKHHRDVNLELAEKASKLTEDANLATEEANRARDQAIIISKENEALTADAKKQAEALAHTIGQKVEQAGKTDALTKDLLDARQEADGLFSYIKKELIPQVRETGALRLIENLKAQIAKYEANHPSQKQAERVADIRESDGEIERVRGHFAAALEKFLSALEIRQRDAQGDPGNEALHDAIAACHERIGEAQKEQGQTEEAETSFRKSLEIRERLCAAHPTDEEAQRRRAQCFNFLGKAVADRRGASVARGTYATAEEIGRRFEGQPSWSVPWARTLAESLSGLGDCALDLKEYPLALKSYEEQHRILAPLAEADPDNARLQFEFAGSYLNLGLVQQRRSHGDEALSALRPCRDICEALIKRESENILWQRRLAYTINRIGQVLDHRGAGSRADALAAYREGYRIRLSLFERLPQNEEERKNLESSYTQLLKILGETKAGKAEADRIKAERARLRSG